MSISIIAKKYNYTYEYYDNNSVIPFLESQLNDLEKIKIGLLLKFKEDLSNSSNKLYKKKYSGLLLNDIVIFLNNYKRAKDELNKTIKIAKRGSFGENKVANIISNYEELKVLSNITLSVEGVRVENDFLIISEKGVFVLEVKSFGSYKDELRIDEYGRVLAVDENDNIKYEYDMLEQNERHIAYLDKVLHNGNIKAPIESIIVIASHIQVKNRCKEFIILGPNQIYNFIRKKESILEKEEVNRIYNYLLKVKEESKQYKYVNYSKVLNKNYEIIINSLIELINE